MKRDNRYVSKETLWEITYWKRNIFFLGYLLIENPHDKDVMTRYYNCMRQLHYWLNKANKEYFKNIGRS